MKSYSIPSDILHSSAFDKHPERIAWLIKLLDAADDEGVITASYRDISLLLVTTRDTARKFLLRFFAYDASRHTIDTPQTHFVLCNPSSYGVVGHTIDTPQTQKRKKSVPNKAEDMTITHRVRLVFEKYVKEHFDEPYYWKAKDAAAAKKLIEEIKFSRLHRATPLSIDDDGVLEGFQRYIESITDKWVLEHFTMSVLHSSFQQIRQQLKAQNHGREVDTDKYIALQRQREAVIDGISKAQAEWERNRKGKSQGG